MAMETATAILLAALAALLLIIVNRRRSGNKLKPPHPPSWPIIGHLHLLIQKRPVQQILASLSEKYGPIMQLQLGFYPVLVISSATMAKECLQKNDKALSSRPLMAAGKYIGYEYKNFGLTPYGSYWRSLRKLCTVQLLSAGRIESFRHIRAEEISDLIRSMLKSSKIGGGPENMKTRLVDIAYNIIVRMVANRRVSTPDHSEDYREAHHFKEMIDETFILLGVFDIGDYLPFLKWLDLQGNISAMKKHQKKTDVYMQKLLEDHRAKRGTSAVQDLIDVLISATDNHEIETDNSDDVVKATALTLILAATDTSSATMEWAMAAMMQQPNILSKAQEELDTHIGRDRVLEESDLPKLKYLQAIVKETFRLYPAGAILVPHEAIEDCTVGGYHVAAGTRLLVSSYAIQRDPAVWERPTEFDPERFLNGGREIDVKGQDFELIPFGSGRRSCPGMSLALTLVTLTLGRLLQSFEWSIPAGTTIDMTEGLGFTMPRAVALEAIIKPRLPLHLY